MDYQWYVNSFNKERQFYGSAETLNESIQVPHYEVESSDEDDLDTFLDKFSSLPHEDEEDVVEFVEPSDEEEDVVEFVEPNEEDVVEFVEPVEEEYEIIGNDEPSEPDEKKEKKTAFDKYGDEIDQLIDKYREVIE